MRRGQKLKGRFQVGDRVHFCGGTPGTDPERVIFGSQGTVIGPSSVGDPGCRRIQVTFDGHDGAITDLPVVQLVTQAPVLPGGYQVDSQVYYCGGAWKWPDGDHLSFGMVGRIVGRSTCEDVFDEERVRVHFEGNRNPVMVFLTSLTRDGPPVIPGDFRLGGKVYFIDQVEEFENGDRLIFGLPGSVTGRSTQGDGLDDNRVQVRFLRNELASDVFLNSITTSRPQIAGEYQVDEVVFYVGEFTAVPKAKKSLAYGNEGRVSGGIPVSAQGSDDMDPMVEVIFVGFNRGTRVTASKLSRERPERIGDHYVGDRVYYCGGQQTFPSGNKLFFGMGGKILGLGSVHGSVQYVKVLFDGNPSLLEVCLLQISKTVPSLPGGYTIGETVFFAGQNETFSNGDKLIFGQPGEVTGRSTSGKACDEERLKVLFNKNKTSINVFLAQISKGPPVIPGGFKVGDKIYFSSQKKQVFKNGDRLVFGLSAQVTGCSTLGDGTDSKRLKAKFEGNKSPINVYISEVTAGDPPSGASSS